MPLPTALARFLPARVLRFASSRTRFGITQVARGAEGADYHHGKLALDMPACAWREPPEGGMQVMALGASFEAALPIMRQMEEAILEGRRMQSIFWPVRVIGGGGFHVRKVPAELRRDATGLVFRPLCLGTSPIRVPATWMNAFLRGERVSDFPNVPSASLPAAPLSHERLLMAARESGLLSKSERFEAAVGVAWTRCLQAGPDGETLRKIRTALDSLTYGLAPVLDGGKPDSARLLGAQRAIEALVASDLAGWFGKAGHLFLTAEVTPLLALAESRKRAPVPTSSDVEAETVAPAYA